MADEIFLRVSELKRKIRGLSAVERAENADVKDSLQAISDLLSKGPYGKYNVSEVGQRARRIAVSSQESQLRDFLKRSSDLFRADQAQSVIAKLQTPEQFLAMEKKLDRLRKTPEEIKHERYVEEYGDVGATSIETEESRIDAKERREKAESLLRQRRLKRGRQEQAAREAFRYDMMDEFDQKMEDLTKRYGGDTGKADTAMRNLLKKELPPFFKNSRMSTKDLHRTAEFFRSAKKMPFVGHAIGLSANPIAASVGLALTALTTSAENSRKIVDWTLKESVTGAPSSKMELAMKKAGVGDQGAVLQKYGAITSWLADLETNPEAWSVLGDVALASKGKVSLAGITSKSTPEDVAKLVAPQLGALSFNERLRTARALGRIGVDEKVINAFETYAGVKETTADQDIVGGVQQRIDTARRMFAEHPFLSADQLVYLVPYLGRLIATLDEQTLRLFGASYSSESVLGDGFNISDAIKATNAAASVDSQASEIISRGQGASGGSTNIKGDTHVTIEVGTIETDSPQDFIKQMKALGSQYFQEVGEAFDQKAR